jgi:hypothetical protein
MGGGGRESKALRSNNGGEREKEAIAQGGRRRPFIGPPRKLAIAGHLPQSLWPWGSESPALGAGVSGPKSPAKSQDDSEPNTEACTTPEIATAGVSGP